MPNVEITFQSPVAAIPYGSFEELPEIPRDIRAKLDGRTEDDELAKYIVDDADLRDCFAGINLSRGAMSLRDVDGEIIIITTFTVDSTLTPSQTSALTSFVSCQYSDGGGAGWLQQFNDEFQLRFEIDFMKLITCSPTL